MEMNEKAVIEKARQVFDIEIEGLAAVRDQLGDGFVKLVAACMETLDRNGKIVVTGVGKSGHVGRKIAATLSSTGSPAIFMHPAEAMHGDLGVLQDGDLMLALSYSGETNELTRIIVPAKRLGVPVACITGVPDSSLAQLSDIVVTGHVEREACPFNLAPTTTSTAQLAIGDALAMVLLEARDFTKEDYGMRHPGGAIGRAVTLRIGDLMRTGEHVAIVSPDDDVKSALLRMTSARCGCAIVADPSGSLLGIFTDGDFRRRIDSDLSILTRKVSEVMTPHPECVRQNALAIEALRILERRHIDDIIVVDDARKVVGLIDIQDLPRFKIM